jgi:hypothetical protein
MANAKFYDVKTRQSVEVPVTAKKVYQGKGGKRYALKGKTSDGRNLTKFVSEADFNASDAPTE